MIGTKTMTDTFTITSAAITDRGLSEKRPQNEDSYLEMRATGIFAVADGVGGAQAGEVASQMAVEILGEAFTNLQSGADAETAMRAAMSQANSAIFQMAHELPQLSAMATTIVALHLNGNIATIGHVGDSRVYSVNRVGEIKRETDDHSVVAEEVRAGRMTEEQADNHPSKNVISRALGAEASVEPDIKTILVEPGTTFLLCSDGITRHVNDDEIKGVLTFGGSPEDVCQFLKNLCYERGAEDNLTAIVVRVGDTADDLPVLQLDGEEPTIASARPTAASSADDDILELDLKEIPTAELPEAPTNVATTSTSTESEPAESAIHESFSQAETVADLQLEEEAHSVQIAEISSQQTQDENFTMFGTSEIAEPEEKSSSLGMIVTALGMLLIGGLIGLGVYHFLLAPKTDDSNAGQLTEMKSENVPFSSFEKLRRTVDSDPASYLKEVPPAEDADDFYLMGRAQLLTGDFQKANFSLIEAQKRLAKTDVSNQKVLANDIAVALAIANNPESQKRFKAELELSSKPPANGMNVNSNR